MAMRDKCRSDLFELAHDPLPSNWQTRSVLFEVTHAGIGCSAPKGRTRHVICLNRYCANLS